MGVFPALSKEHQPPLVDCISAGRPSLLIDKDINEVAVPLQILAPGINPAYPAGIEGVHVREGHETWLVP